MRQGDEVQPRFKGATAKALKTKKRSWPSPAKMRRYNCEVTLPHKCTGKATESHHIVLRSRGGSDDETNLLACCLPGHHYLHAHPTEATDAGFMKHAGA